MKKALIRLVVLPIIIVLITILSVVINSIYPPQKVTSQVTPQMAMGDSNKGKAAFEEFIETTKEKAAFVAGMEAGKKTPKVVVKERKVYIPIVRKKRPAKPVKEDIPDPPKLYVQKVFAAPVYKGTKERTKPTYQEWKDSRGLLQKKDYITYQNQIK